MSKEPKIVVMGSENVGKTTIMEKLIGNIGKVEYNGTTVAIDYGNIILNNRKIHLFGTPGQPRFEFMREITLNGAYFVLLIVDATTGLKDIDKKIINTIHLRNIPYAVFINKIDSCNDEILNNLKKEINELCPNCEHIMKGSALNDKGISKLKLILENI
ncbi:GTP-binding protein [Methanococcus aeolicus]|nr:GTP-binding protein [Methanococcus aeolicus]